METREEINGMKYKWAILAVIVLKVFMDGLDSSMLNIALPSISDALGVASGTIVWIVSAYSITTAVTVLFFGRLGDIIGKTKFYLFGIAVYVLSTLVSGLARSFPLLLISRIVQAIGAGCTMANSQGLITLAFPKHQRGTALGIYSGAISIGSLAGPTLGGLIVRYMNWRGIFLLKLPLAIPALIIGLKFFPKDVALKDEKMDYCGAALFVTALGPLLYALQRGASGGFLQLPIILALAVSVISFAAFFILQKKSAMPLLDLGLFRNPYYSIGVLNLFILAFTNALRNIIFPYYMQGVLGMPADKSGLYLSIAPVITLVISPISGYLSDRLSGEKISLIGQIIHCVGMLLTATLTRNSAASTMVILFCVVSFGSALFSSPNNSLIMSTVPRDKLGIGGSASTAIRNTGTSMGVAFASLALYGGMSRFLGYEVTDYVMNSGMDDAFVFSMRNAHIIAAAICAVGVAGSVIRLLLVHRKRSTAETVENK